MLLRIAVDIDELARARSVEDLEHTQVDRDVRAERRRRGRVWRWRRVLVTAGDLDVVLVARS